MQNLNSITATKTRYMVTTSLFSALIFLTTAYILHIPIGGNNGYVHIGDAFIYLGAAILPTPYALVCAAIGAGMADFASGSAIWIIPTIIIKPILVLFFTSKEGKIINTRNVISGILAGLVGWVLYMVAEGIIVGSFASAFIFSLIGLIQPIGSFIVFIIMGLMFDKLGVKKFYL